MTHAKQREVLDERNKRAAELHSTMLNTAFDLLCTEKRDYLTPSQLLNLLRRCEGGTSNQN